MTVKDELHSLVDRLDQERLSEALEYLNSLVGDGGGVERATGSSRERGGAPPVVSGHGFRTQPRLDWQTLAAQQGVGPVTDFDRLRGDFWPEDETADEFIAAVREWRREGGRA